MKSKTLIPDILLVLSVVAVSVLMLFSNMRTASVGSYVTVEVDGKTVGRYSLSEDAEIKINNGTNTLRIKDGFASMVHADCPDQICVRQRKINRQGQSVVCLPNKVVISVEQSEKGVDFVL